MFRPEMYQQEEADQTVLIHVTPKEMEMLRFVEQQTGIAPADLIETFIGDLCCSWRNGGSDERMKAFDWFRRRGYTEDYESTNAFFWKESIEAADQN